MASLTSLLASQIESILRLQQLHGLTPLMKALTFLGNEEFFLLLLPLFYFCIHAKTGLRLGLLVILGDTLNLLLKLSLAQPRPYWMNTRVHPLTTDPSFGLPSSHAQNAASVWGYLASLTHRRWAWVAAIILTLLISLSRVHLGVHFWSDVLAGWLVGSLILAVFLRKEPSLEAWFEGQPLTRQLLLVTSLVFALFLFGMAALALSAGSSQQVTPWGLYVPAARNLEPLLSRLGALWGLGIGWALALRGEPYSAGGPVPLRILRWLVGMIGLLLFWKGLPLLLPFKAGLPALILRFIRYALMTLWVTYLAPKLFQRIGLAPKEMRSL